VACGSATLQWRLVAGAGVEPALRTAYETVEPPLLYPRVRKDCGGGSRTRVILVYKTSALKVVPSELRRRKSESGLEETRTLTRSLQDFYATSYITSPKN
jgi:hypothetical protein